MVRLRIKELAEQQGLNRSQLQRRSGVTLPMLYRYWDNNTESVHLRSMERLAKVLGVQVRDLFAAEDPPALEPEPMNKPVEGVEKGSPQIGGPFETPTER